MPILNAPASLCVVSVEGCLTLSRFADRSISFPQEMARALDASGQGEAAVLAATAASDVKTALHLAAMEGRMDVLKYLVEDLRLDVNPRHSKGRFALPSPGGCFLICFWLFFCRECQSFHILLNSKYSGSCRLV